MLDSALQGINPHPREKYSLEAGDFYYQNDQPNCVIHWIEIYPADNSIHGLNNRCLVLTCLCLCYRYTVWLYTFFEETTAQSRL